MCPVVLLALCFSLLLLLLELTAALNVTFIPKELKLKEDDHKVVNYTLYGTSAAFYEVVSNDDNIASVAGNKTFYVNTGEVGTFEGSFTMKGNFLGYTQVRIRRVDKSKISEPMRVIVERKERTIAKIFAISVAVLVSLNYINMGCALDLQVVKNVLRKPVAPAVGLFCQFITMPLISYGLGKLIFKQTVLQLGLFTFGCSPGGGASNMWTVLLKGNLNLSLTLTFISTLAALGMMPLWLFTLGRTLFEGTSTVIPYTNLFTLLVSMVVPVGFGLLMQRYLPKVANFCRRILAPVSILMIIYIICFGTYANLYMFKLFSWRVVLAATINVWLGFLFGAVTSKLIKLTVEDIIAISIETGVQNTGISIVLLTLSLHSPDSDLASVVPVAASIMTPIPLLVVYAYQKIKEKYFHKKGAASYIENNEDCRSSLPTPVGYNASSEEKSFINGHI